MEHSKGHPSRRLLAACLLGSACAHSVSETGGSVAGQSGGRAERQGDAVTTYRSRLSAAKYYDERRPISLDSQGFRLYRVLGQAAQKAGRSTPTVDLAAQHAALELCLGLPTRGPPPSELVDFALHVHGIIDPPPHIVLAEIFGAGDGLGPDFVARLSHVLRAAHYRRVGLARCPSGKGRARILVALFDSRVRLAPIPRRLAHGQSVSLALEVAASHRQLALFVSTPDGSVRNHALQRQADASYYRGVFACDKRGTYRIQVTGVGRLGQEVLANFPIFCGTRPPRQLSLRTATTAIAENAAALSRELFERTNQVRQQAGLPALRRNSRLTAVATGHSEEMRDRGYVGHRSALTGGPADRLQRAGIAYLVARENVARAYSIKGAVSQWLKSPAHRSNILSRDVVELGVGVAVAREHGMTVLFLTQNFIQPAE